MLCLVMANKRHVVAVGGQLGKGAVRRRCLSTGWLLCAVQRLLVASESRTLSPPQKNRLAADHLKLSSTVCPCVVLLTWSAVSIRKRGTLATACSGLGAGRHGRRAAVFRLGSAHYGDAFEQQKLK